MGSQVGLINISLGKSSDPDVEEEILNDVASYGKQLGRVEDALLVLLDHFRPQRKLTDEEEKAISDLRTLMQNVAAVKASHGRDTGPSTVGEPHSSRRSSQSGGSR
jgi:hypothetical protein